MAVGRPTSRFALLAAIVTVFGCLFVFRAPTEPATGFALEPLPTETASAEPVFQTQFVSGGIVEHVHSAAVVEQGDGRLRSFWFGGTREGAPDSVIFTAVCDAATGTWSDEEAMIDRAFLQRHLGRFVGTVGNPVALRVPDGRLLLWFVSVSVGGWSGSAINVMRSDDDGATWSPPERLVTSPFFNFSTLVKGAPFLFADGTIGLPVYHEHLGKFAELLRLDADGNVRHKQRLTWGRGALQPTIVPRSTLEATCLLRRAPGTPRFLLSQQTVDGGATWSPPVSLDMPNPGAPVAGLRLDDGDLLMVLNENDQLRDDLRLVRSPDDGQTYSMRHPLEGETTDERGLEDGVSYPSIIRTANGEYHLVYTWHRHHIKHVHFNEAWLEGLP